MKRRDHFLYRIIALFLSVTFPSQFIIPPTPSYSQTFPGLPAVGQMVFLSSKFTPYMIVGVKVFLEDPLRFNFIVNGGDSRLEEKVLREEVQRLIKYFLAGLTIPEKELWVNLSPAEKERIVSTQLA